MKRLTLFCWLLLVSVCHATNSVTIRVNFNIITNSGSASSLPSFFTNSFVWGTNQIQIGWAIYPAGQTLSITSTAPVSVYKLLPNRAFTNLLNTGTIASMTGTTGHYFVQSGRDRKEFLVVPSDYSTLSNVGWSGAYNNCSPGATNRAEKAKLGWVRTTLAWDAVQITNGAVYNWTGPALCSYPAESNLLTHVGRFKTLVNFYSPSWATNITPFSSYLTALSNFLVAAYSRYSNQVDVLEPLNEPSALPLANVAFNTNNYGNIEKQIFQVFAATWPGKPLVGPAEDTAYAMSRVQWIKDVSGESYIDLDFHDYESGWTNQPPDVIDSTNSVNVITKVATNLAALGKTSGVWISEVGLYGQSALGIPDGSYDAKDKQLDWYRGMCRSEKLAVMYAVYDTKIFPHILTSEANIEICGWDSPGTNVNYNAGIKPKTGAFLMTEHWINGFSMSTTNRTGVLWDITFTNATDSVRFLWTLEGTTTNITSVGTATDIYGNPKSSTAFTEEPTMVRSATVTTFDPVPSARLPYGGTWEGIVGVKGGILTNRAAYTNLALGATASQINTALANCPSNKAVVLASGIYTCNAAIYVGNNFTTLRGATNTAGNPATKLVFTGSDLGALNVNATGGAGWNPSSTSGWTTRYVTNAIARGDSSFYVTSSITGLATNQIMWISAPSSAAVTGGGWSDLFGSRPFAYPVKVTGWTGNRITFEPAYNSDYATNNIQVNWQADSNAIKFSGIENLAVNASSEAAYPIYFLGADNCWAFNCSSTNVSSGFNQMYLYLTHRVEVRRCDFRHFQNDASANYNISVLLSGEILIEDNFSQDAPAFAVFFGIQNSVISYNYAVDITYTAPAWLPQVMMYHGSHNAYNLFEGNWVPTSFHDGVNPGSRNTVYFRNRMRGKDENVVQGTPKTDNCEAITICPQHANMTLVGNLFGQTGFHNAITNVFSGDQDIASGTIYNLSETITNTLRLIGNWNAVSGAIPANEAIGAGTALVTSYVHTSKPSWFNGLTWPPYSPTVSSGTNATQIPAGYRFINGVDP